MCLHLCVWCLAPWFYDDQQQALQVLCSETTLKSFSLLHADYEPLQQRGVSLFVCCVYVPGYVYIFSLYFTFVDVQYRCMMAIHNVDLEDYASKGSDHIMNSFFIMMRVFKVHSA